MVDRASLPMVCNKSWDELGAGDAVRHCRTCMRPVWDLGTLTMAELQALVAYHGPDICARVPRLPDGTPVGRDCSAARPPIPGGMRMPLTAEQIEAQKRAEAERAAALGHDRAKCPICSGRR